MFRRLGVEWLKGGDGFVRHPHAGRSRDLARATWALAAAELRKGDYRLLVLDEITLPISFHWIDVGEVVAAIHDRAPSVNVILTVDGHPSFSSRRPTASPKWSKYAIPSTTACWPRQG
jgi:ATP:corrinoid adenosyltransferase